MVSNKIISNCLIFLFFLVAIYFANCSPANELKAGKDIYKAYCVNCHGADGRLGTNAALDLSRSGLSLEGRKDIIRHGRVTMMGFDKVLTDDQIDSVANYTLKLKQ